MVAPPRKSATIILVRDRREEGFEVFLLKRSMESNFMAGNYVYPGGRVDKGDYDPEISLLCSDGMDIPLDQERLVLRIAGIRELYEEAGIILAVDRSGNDLSLDNKAVRMRFKGYRHALLEGQISLLGIAEKEGLLLNTKALYRFAHWITPEGRPVRFDTHFYYAHLPPGQVAMADQRETTDGLWISPEQALYNNLKGEMVLSPPTLKTLEDMARYNSAEELISSCADKDIPVVVPVLVQTEEYGFVVFPWDPEYGDAAKGNITYPLDHGALTMPGEMTTRVIFKDGRSIPYCRKGPLHK
ncbi:MAG: hypothetical protein C0392_09870 [Syntrophus sp. (in: bacteria)]|nr:hypothetical protein [Syntrophus sp. (in: bacteria)]